MSVIKVLPKQVSELIAAGEVVERPASAIKELVENSIDAHATNITVEIQNGGITYMRVTDNGCGIGRDDIKTAFLRHATSKVSTESDLGSIATLGFRGEALAAISSVSRIEMMTKTKQENIGTSYVCEGGEAAAVEDAGCPDGTTIIVRDLFYNTPARMKFLKKDIAEGNAVAGVIYNIALSHPEISIGFIRDGKSVIKTPGDGDLMSAIYAVTGREFAAGLIPVKGDLNGISIHGFVSKPSACRPKKNAQFVFLNGRFVRSGTVAAAIEQAYKNSAMVGRFPAAVLHLTVPYNAVDINVHPAKTEVRFSDEKRIFDCVFFSVKNALVSGDKRPEMNLKKTMPFSNMSVSEYKQSVLPGINKKENDIEAKPNAAEQIDDYAEILLKAQQNRHGGGKFSDFATNSKTNTTYGYYQKIRAEKPSNIRTPDEWVNIDLTDSAAKKLPDEEIHESDGKSAVKDTDAGADKVTQITETNEKIEPDIRFLGEAFCTYIIAEKGDSVFLIDKHAAHERILFNRLKKADKPMQQLLLVPETVVLQPADYNAVIENAELLQKAGFEVADFGDCTVIVRAVPTMLSGENVSSLIFEIADGLQTKRMVEVEKQEWIFETTACRAAVKAGNLSSKEDLEYLAKEVLSDNSIMYCPHGRPVAIELTKKNIEKQFGRIQ